VTYRPNDAAAVPRLSRWPIVRPPDWTRRVNMPMTPAEEEAVQRNIRRRQPYGTERWQKGTASRLGLESTSRPRGRPSKKPNNGTLHLFRPDTFSAPARNQTTVPDTFSDTFSVAVYSKDLVEFSQVALDPD
jgi:hypothetical protein